MFQIYQHCLSNTNFFSVQKHFAPAQMFLNEQEKYCKNIQFSQTGRICSAFNNFALKRHHSRDIFVCWNIRYLHIEAVGFFWMRWFHSSWLMVDSCIRKQCILMWQRMISLWTHMMLIWHQNYWCLLRNSISCTEQHEVDSVFVVRWSCCQIVRRKTRGWMVKRVLGWQPSEQTLDVPSDAFSLWTNYIMTSN